MAVFGSEKSCSCLCRRMCWAHPPVPLLYPIFPVFFPFFFFFFFFCLLFQSWHDSLRGLRQGHHRILLYDSITSSISSFVILGFSYWKPTSLPRRPPSMLRSVSLRSSYSKKGVSGPGRFLFL